MLTANRRDDDDEDEATPRLQSSCEDFSLLFLLCVFFDPIKLNIDFGGCSDGRPSPSGLIAQRKRYPAFES